ncbi:hypothetical protein [Rhodoflexus caldus]|uniref:hypothetical protein n=1 Tax=Rhodoflexus caldus TaxID=2891236 RepID=UPI00202A580D|nr:hypothetical protein [Rhodoflexus caldus]
MIYLKPLIPENIAGISRIWILPHYLPEAIAFDPEQWEELYFTYQSASLTFDVQATEQGELSSIAIECRVPATAFLQPDAKTYLITRAQGRVMLAVEDFNRQRYIVNNPLYPMRLTYRYESGDSPKSDGAFYQLNFSNQQPL